MYLLLAEPYTLSPSLSVSTSHITLLRRGHTVKLMSSIDFPKAVDSVGMAGRYMLDVNGLGRESVYATSA